MVMVDKQITYYAVTIETNDDPPKSYKYDLCRHPYRDGKFVRIASYDKAGLVTFINLDEAKIDKMECKELAK